MIRRKLLLAGLVLAAAGCADASRPVRTTEPAGPEARPGDDTALFEAARQAAPIEGSDAGLTIGILDEGRSADGATVVYWNGADYRGVRFRREGGAWTPAGAVDVRPAAPAGTADDGRAVLADASPLGEARSLNLTLLYTYPFPPLQNGSYTHTNPTPFGGDGARTAHWTRTNPATHDAAGKRWSVTFTQWQYCRVWSSSSTSCLTSISTWPSTVHSNNGSHTVALYYSITSVVDQTVSASVCEGTASITSEGTYTWKVCPTGGSGSYTYAWQSSTDSGSTWSNVGSGQTYSRQVLGGQPSFQLRATVTSNGVSAVATHSVSVVIPFVVWISGTSRITAKGTYTFTPQLSGAGTGTLTYEWYERYCGNLTEGSCGAWSVPINVNPYTRVLSPDCSGTGEASVQLKVTVTRSGGGTATSSVHRTWLCNLLPN